MKTARRKVTGLLMLVLAAAPALADSDDGGPLTGFHRQWAWTAPGYATGSGGFEVVDVDGDGQPELLVASNAGYPAQPGRGYWALYRYRNGAFDQLWSSLAYEEGLVRVRFVPDQGGKIVAASPDRIRVYDGRTRQFEREFPVAGAGIADFVVADLDGTGGLKLAVCDYLDLRIYDFATGNLNATRSGFGGSALAVGQVDADPQPELGIAGNSSGGFLLDGASLEVQFGDLRGFGDQVVLTDLDGDGLDEVLAEAADIGGRRAQDPEEAMLLWEIPSIYYLGGFGARDLDGNGSAEVFLHSGSSTLWVHDGLSGAWLWSLELPSSYQSVLTAGDADGDGAVEVYVGVRGNPSDARLVAVDAQSRALEGASPNLGGPFYGFGSGDLAADGGAGLVTTSTTPYSNAGTTRVIEFDVEGRELRRFGAPLNGWSDLGYGAIAAQLDADPPFEICVPFSDSSYYAHVRCEDGASHELEWQVDLGEFPRRLAAFQLDGDASLELVAGTYESYLYAFEGDSGWLKWRTPALFGSWEHAFLPIRAADFDGDGQLEIATSRISDTYAADVVIFRGSDGLLFSGPFRPVDVSALEAAQFDADPEPDLLVGTPGGQVFEMDVYDGTLATPILDLGSWIESLAVADVTRDGVPDLVVAADDRISVFGGTEQAIVWTSPFLGRHGGWRDTLNLGNFDHDGFPEILVGTDDGFVIFETPYFAVFADGFESGDTSAWSGAVP